MNINQPKIRFKGFNDSWEQRQVSEYASFLKGNGLSLNDITDDGEQDCILYGNLYTDYGMIAKKVVYKTNTKVKNPVYSKLGDVLIPASDTTPTGLARATSIEKSGVLLGGDINIVRPNKGIKGSCLSLALNANKKELIRLIKGTTVKHISNSDIKEIEICLPKTEDEQENISTYFLALDNLITLHKRKVYEISDLKKSMLEKLFPQEDKKIPEYRFKGFTGEWEQRKLGDLADIVGGGTPKTEINEYWNGNIDWYTPAEIGNHVYLNFSERKITQEGYANSSAKIMPIGTVLFTSRAGIGKTGILSKEACTNQGFQSIVPREKKLDSYFIFSRSKELKEYGETVGAGSTFVEVSGKQMEKMELMMPKLFLEQKKIGAYFKDLDNLITLHQCKIEYLKELKKSMLDYMFI